MEVKPFNFNISKYMGTWYELVHYPSWFQRNDNYNTVAKYGLNFDGTVDVLNTTISQGKLFESHGTAKSLVPGAFRVDFAMPEVEKLQQSNEFKPNIENISNDPNVPNYLIDKLWINMSGEYTFAVVTDCDKQSLYVLSRYEHPPLTTYNEIMTYVVANYDRDRLVQTPHYH